MTEADTGANIELTGESTVQASLGTRWAALTHESVVFDVLTDRVFQLNSTAAFIWERLQEPCRVADLQAAVREGYEIDADEADEATLELLRWLLGEGLVATDAQQHLRKDDSAQQAPK